MTSLVFERPTGREGVRAIRVMTHHGLSSTFWNYDEGVPVPFDEESDPFQYMDTEN